MQAAAIVLIFLGVAGLGTLIFSRRGLDNMVPVYVFAGLALVGFAGNAVAAALRVLLEKDRRK